MQISRVSCISCISRITSFFEIHGPFYYLPTKNIEHTVRLAVHQKFDLFIQINFDVMLL